ncbi:MAG: NAD(P)/FAD-dependent oxidoreductase [Methanomassiliicoccaceae archaeon]|nr:NAD(P)/FAD-dependent oxidoreductase [Methanomassiliicoccaceae archaeon]
MDIVIIGAGPAGIQAAIHASRGKAAVTMIGKRENSAIFGTHVENYFAIGGKANGSEMLDVGIAQAEAFGTKHLEENVTSIIKSENMFTVITENGSGITAKAIILASGVSRMKLNIPGEKEFFGKGVSYCAECDCNFYKGKRVAVIGDESEAAASAELMTQYASHVFWITKDTRTSDVMIKKAADAGVEIINEKASEIKGKENVKQLVLTDGSAVDVDGVFIELGGRSSSDLAMDVDVLPDADGTVRTDERCRTSVTGVYACGDITGKPWQIAKAVGQGATAGLNAVSYVKGNAGE